MGARSRRKRAAAIARYEAALALKCPICAAAPGIQCFFRPGLGPDLHARRYHDVSRKKS